MSNGQHSVSSDRLMTSGISTDPGRQPSISQRPSIVRQLSTKTMAKPAWQVARDISMNILSRKTSKLSVKQATTLLTNNHQRLTKNEPLPDVRSLSIHRTPRMPTSDEAAQIAIAYDSLCSFCNEPCIGDNVRCRVCIKTCHILCLFQRGHVSDQSFSFRRLSKQDWSCPECTDLTRLLSQEELHHLIYAFEQIDRNKDGYIILEEFLSLRMDKNMPDDMQLFVQHSHELGKKYFSLMDSRQKGAVAWSDFALFYCCKLIAAKDKIELTTKLTTKELVLAKSLYFKDPKKTFDNDCNIIITREHFNQIHYDLMVSLKRKYGVEFIEEVLSYGHHTEDLSEQLSVMTWREYLRELSLLILLDRSNNDVKSAETPHGTIPPHLSNASVVFRPVIPSNEHDASSRSTLSRLHTPALPHITSSDDSFRKHARILEKLARRNKDEEFRRKQYGSLTQFTIVENSDEKEDFHLPQLKANARDDRKSIVDPWTAVKEMQQIRNQPILLPRTRLRMIQT